MAREWEASSIILTIPVQPLFVECNVIIHTWTFILFKGFLKWDFHFCRDMRIEKLVYYNYMHFSLSFKLWTPGLFCFRCFHTNPLSFELWTPGLFCCRCFHTNPFKSQKSFFLCPPFPSLVNKITGNNLVQICSP